MSVSDRLSDEMKACAELASWHLLSSALFRDRLDPWVESIVEAAALQHPSHSEAQKIEWQRDYRSPCNLTACAGLFTYFPWTGQVALHMALHLNMNAYYE